MLPRVSEEQHHEMRDRGQGFSSQSSEPMNTVVDSASSRERPLEVDVARLLLILNRFAWPPDEATQQLGCWPDHEVSRVLTPEYYLQKLDFLVRYPAYLAYELIELHRLGQGAAVDANNTRRAVEQILVDREPELRTNPFRRFLRGAYERLDDVQAWWHSRGLVYTQIEARGQPGTTARPQKYFFLSPKGEQVSASLIAEVDHARWYAERIELIHRYFGSLTPAELKSLQYSHPEYRDAQLNEFIPDLSLEYVHEHFTHVYGTALQGTHV